jgi:hypothetical protein
LCIAEDVDTVISVNKTMNMAGSADVPSALANYPADEDVGAPIASVFVGAISRAQVKLLEQPDSQIDT